MARPLLLLKLMSARGVNYFVRCKEHSWVNEINLTLLCIIYLNKVVVFVRVTCNFIYNIVMKIDERFDVFRRRVLILSLFSFSI